MSLFSSTGRLLLRERIYVWVKRTVCLKDREKRKMTKESSYFIIIFHCLAQRRSDKGSRRQLQQRRRLSDVSDEELLEEMNARCSDEDFKKRLLLIF